MPKLKDLRIFVLTDNERVDFTTPVSVSKDGIFSTTLPKEANEKLSAYGLAMSTNRIGNPGYFSAKTLEELDKDITSFAKECISRKLVDECLVIKYEINTRCNYIKDEDGELNPNGLWTKKLMSFEEGKARWRVGNDNPPQNKCTPSISVWAKVFNKKTYRYHSGKEIVKYEYYEPNTKRQERTSLDWINSLCNTSPSKETIFRTLLDDDIIRMPEVDATQQNGQFFITMYQLIFKMNEMFHDFNQPGAVEYFLKNNSLPQLTF